MADARALLRAKRQEARISHPLASYNAAGQLRCIICGTLVKFASAWEGHLGSKAHRTNVARVKEEERKREEARAREEEEEREREAAAEAQVAGNKRKAVDGDDAEDSDAASATSKKQKKMETKSGFPADFFSDPSRAPVLADNDSDNEGEGEGEGGEKQEGGGGSDKPRSAIDMEYERFQKEFLEAPDFRETYERATVMAEPELAPEVPEGFPAAEGKAEGAAGVEEQPGLTEEEKRQQKETEEKELIMDRLMEEEQAQEEADMKVQMMKNRLEAFKKQREAARLAKKMATWYVKFPKHDEIMIHKLNV